MPYRDQPGRLQCVGYDPFAQPSASARFLRIPARIAERDSVRTGRATGLRVSGPYVPRLW